MPLLLSDVSADRAKHKISAVTMATVLQQPVGQPMFVPPGVAPQFAAAPPMPAMAPGSVLYYPQMAGPGGGVVVMVRVATYRLD